MALALCWAGGEVRAQHVSFSMPLRAPVFMNPALVGNSDYMRLTLVAQSQWLNVKSPYNTIGVSYDMHFGPYNNHALGVGALNDIQGPGAMQVAEAFLAYSYALHITYEFSMRFGVQLGAIMKSTRYDKLIFPDQLTAQSGSAMPITYVGKLKAAPDFALGVTGAVAGWDFGVAMHHVAEPIFGVKREQWNVAYRKLTVNVSKAFNVYHKYRFKEPLFITPHLIFTQQQRDLRLNVGCAVDYRWITASLWLRERLLYESHGVAASVGYVGNHFEAGYTYEMGFMPENFMGINASVHEVYMSLKFPYPRRSRLSATYGRKNKSIFGKSLNRKKVYQRRRARR